MRAHPDLVVYDPMRVNPKDLWAIQFLSQHQLMVIRVMTGDGDSELSGDRTMFQFTVVI